MDPSVSRSRAAVTRAATGLLVESGPNAEAMTHLLGPLLFAHLIESVALGEGFADRTVERFLAAYGPDRVATGVQ